MRAQFLTPLDLRLVDDQSNDGRGTWLTLGTCEYWSEIAGRRLRVPKNFRTDLASVPKLPIAYVLFGGRGSRAAVLHDWLYTCHELPRDVADQVFREALLVTGVPEDLAESMYLAVRLGGGSAWDAPGQAQSGKVTEYLSTACLEAA